MLFPSLRKSSLVFFSMIISCLILAECSEAIAAFRFGGGSYSLGYQTHKETEDGNLIGKADILSQRLSLSTINRGYALGMRSSPYSIFLGYNHRRHSTNIMGSSYSPSVSDLTWSGTLSLKPTRKSGMSLFVMSRKNENSIFESDSQNRAISAGFPVSVTDQVWSEHGISIIKGHKRTLKSYLSFYHSSNGYSARKDERDFSHLSLQRGINWLHFDLEERQVTSSAPYKRLSIRLGNISHQSSSVAVPTSYRNGPREWFRLTNWFEISTDMEYVKTERGALNDTSLYGVSFFGRGYRKVWDMLIAPDYFTVKSSARNFRRVTIPVSAAYFPDKKFEISSYTYYEELEARNNSGDLLSESDSVQESLRAVIMPQPGIHIRPSYNITRRNSDGLIGLYQDVGIRITTEGDKFNTSLLGDYRTSELDDISGTDFKSDSVRIRAGGLYKRFAFVRNTAFSHEYISVSDNTGNSSETNTTEVSSNIVPSSRFKVDFTALRTETDANGAITQKTKFESTLAYDSKKRFANNLFIYVSKRENEATSRNLTRLRDEATYRFSKALESKTEIESVKESNEAGDSNRITFEEGIYYSRNYGGFFGRKMYDLSGTYKFIESDRYGAQSRKASSYSLSLDYYPTTVISLGGIYSYSSNNSTNVNTRTAIYARMNYPKLRMGIRYKTDVKEDSSGEKTTEEIIFSLTKYF